MLKTIRTSAALAVGALAALTLATAPALALPPLQPITTLIPLEGSGAAGAQAQAPAATGKVAAPPAAAKVDYQIGGAYAPPAGVAVVIRDWQAAPAAGLYNIAYVNALQAQPGSGVGSSAWFSSRAPELLLSRNGSPVVDGGWDERLLDISTPAKRQRLVDLQKPWLDEIAKRGYRAVEPDNQDSFRRSQGTLSTDDAWAYLTLFTKAAHERGLAVAQKNNAEYAGIGKSRIGFDFAVAEECAAWNECGSYTAAYDRSVIEIEYSDQSIDAFNRSVAQRGGQISIVRRDRGVSPAGSSGYYYRAG